MKIFAFSVLIFLFSFNTFADKKLSEFHSFIVKDSKNNDYALSQFAGKNVLVVNVASKCGYTNQYEGLQSLYKKFENKNFVILGFPSNDFFGQEPGSNEEIQKFCKLTYGVTFPVLAKVKVKGDDMVPLYKWLTSQKGFEGKISWNFNKFLVNGQGQIVKRYASSDKPEEIEKEIGQLIK